MFSANVDGPIRLMWLLNKLWLRVSQPHPGIRLSTQRTRCCSQHPIDGVTPHHLGHVRPRRPGSYPVAQETDGSASELTRSLERSYHR